MSLAPGSRLGPYEITAKLGEGGMGEVFQAKDFQLGRNVALKVLPDGFTRDPERLARFEREAKLLAQLNHPNIAQIYGFETSGDTRALVMELAPGPTLAERLAAGPLPFTESLSVALQMAQALEEAHEKGIVHRDLKPQNIKASLEGRVKVLDFGLAKAMEPGYPAGISPSDLADSPTLTLGGTREGVILGTAAYMAPEQARGLPVDKRADVWAFGVVLWEMLVGRRMFHGELVSDTLANVLKSEVDFGALPGDTPPGLLRLLRRCLERDPKERLRDIGEARIELAALARGEVVEAGTSAPPRSRRGGSTRLAWFVAALAIVVAAFSTAHLVSRGSDQPAPELSTRTLVSIPAPLRGEAVEFAFSPAGDAVAFVAPYGATASEIWVRVLADPEPRRLAGTAGASKPFWSAGGREIAYFADGKLYRIPRDGGAPRTVCKWLPGGGAAWGPDGTILLGARTSGPLERVAAAGGQPQPALTLAPGESWQRFPAFLPDGKHFVFATRSSAAAEDRFPLKLGSLERVDSGRELLAASTAAHFAPPRHLVYSVDQALVAHEIDLDRLALVGEPRVLAEAPAKRFGFVAQPRAEPATDGSLLYLALDDRESEIVWIDREGNELQVAGRVSGDFIAALPAPDDRRLLLHRYPNNSHTAFWIRDMTSGALSRLSPKGWNAQSGIWSRDGLTVVESHFDSSGAAELVRIDTLSGEIEPIVKSGGRRFDPGDLSADGRLLLATEGTRARAGDILYFDLAGAQPREISYLATAADERAIAFLPGGRSVLYTTDASARRELYVGGFPEPGRPTRLASAGEIKRAYWNEASDELFTLTGEGDRYVVESREVRTEPDLQVGPSRRLFELSAVVDWAPTSDGRRGVILRRVGPAEAALVYVTNALGGTKDAP